jgi:hypothetical protein
MNRTGWILLPALLLASQAQAQTPTLTIGDAIKDEGDSGLTSFDFTLTLSEPSSVKVKVKWHTESCTAIPGNPPCADGDYIPDDGIVTFLAGQTTRTITVKVIGDTDAEGDELFFVVLSEPQNATLSTERGQGQGMIENDDHPLPTAPAVDFNHDGRTDILWRNRNSNRLVSWYMKGLDRTFGEFLAFGGAPVEAGVNDRVAAVADFNRNGNADVVLQNELTGDLTYWYFDGHERTDARVRPGDPDPHWKIQGSADFNSDGKVDFFWRHEQTGHMKVWYMNDRDLLGEVPLNPPFAPSIADPSVADMNWLIAGVGDLDGDGNPDLLFRHAESHRLVGWLLDGVNRVRGLYVTPDRPIDHLDWDVVGLWDTNRDGRADIVFRNTTSGALVVWFMGKDLQRICGTYFNPPALADLGWFMVGPR